MTGQSGLAMATHYCGGMEVESRIVVGHTELHCGMSNMERYCSTNLSKGNHFKNKPCCENEFQSFDLEDEFQHQVIEISVNLEFVAVFFITIAYRTYSTENDKEVYLNYFPPPLERNILVLVQSFLI